MGSTERPVVLDLLREARREQVELQRTLRQRLWDQYNQELVVQKHRVSRLMNQAASEGVSMSAIGRELGTRNWTVIKELMALAATEVQSEAAVMQSVEEAEAAALAEAEAAEDAARKFARKHPWEYDPDTDTVAVRYWIDSERNEHYESRVLIWDRQSATLRGDTSSMTVGSIQSVQALVRQQIAGGPTPAPPPRPVAETEQPAIDWTMFGMPDDEDDDE